MKRCVCLLFLIALCLAFLSGCTEKTSWEPTSIKTVNNFDGVSMTTNDEVVSAKGLTVVFENNSDSRCVYGEDFLIEKKIKGKWYQVPFLTDKNYIINDLGHNLASDKSEEWNVEWDWLYGSLDTGEYRIIKNIMDFRGTGDYDEYKLSAEFTIF